MSNNVTRRCTVKRNVLLALLVFGLAATLLAPSVLGASKTDEKSSDKEVTLFDPFAMQTIALANGNGASAPKEWSFTRRVIRIPFRPYLRSAFKPVW